MADNGNMKLVCVVLRTHGANIYPDTKNLFEYVFNNFQKIPVADEKKPTEVKEFITASDESENAGSAQTGGNEYQPLEDGYVILPKDVSYKDVDYEITDVDEKTGEGTIQYTYDGHPVGSATAKFTGEYLQKISTGKELRAESKSSMGVRPEEICREIGFGTIYDRRRMCGTGDPDRQPDRCIDTPEKIKDRGYMKNKVKPLDGF